MIYLVIYLAIIIYSLIFDLQKFFVNDVHWQHSDGPVFLYIEGEGPLSKFSVLFG